MDDSKTIAMSCPLCLLICQLLSVFVPSLPQTAGLEQDFPVQYSQVSQAVGVVKRNSLASMLDLIEGDQLSGWVPIPSKRWIHPLVLGTLVYKDACRRNSVSKMNVWASLDSWPQRKSQWYYRQTRYRGIYFRSNERKAFLVAVVKWIRSDHLWLWLTHWLDSIHWKCPTKHSILWIPKDRRMKPPSLYPYPDEDFLTHEKNSTKFRRSAIWHRRRNPIDRLSSIPLGHAYYHLCGFLNTYGPFFSFCVEGQRKNSTTDRSVNIYYFGSQQKRNTQG